jgi:hypothetical protein
MPRYVNGLYDGAGIWASSGGSTIAAAASLYVAPSSTTGSASTFYFTYFTAPTIVGTTANAAYTLYIAGPPSNSSNSYSLYINSGISYFGGATSLAATTSFSGATNAILASGSGAIDFSGNSGVFKTSTGAVTIGNGAVSVTGASTFSNKLIATGTGNSTTTLAPIYIAPASTAGSNTTFYFTYLTAPTITGTNASTAYTMYIAGAPSGATTAYAFYAGGNCMISGNLNITGKLTADGGTSPSTLNPKIITGNVGVQLLVDDQAYIVIKDASTFTLTLPSIQTTTTNGIQYYITNIGTGIVTLTVANPLSENFDGSGLTSMTLYQYDRIFVLAITNTATSQYIWQTY